ncbi:hypothetical protein AB0K52_12685 [Glycomyces sp. NPDC049804]|uniref:hypothetical protein n=1 Tax=Glycomyces sp. NPDC049804 TaxID=3154363 RepID=UPI00342C6438
MTSLPPEERHAPTTAPWKIVVMVMATLVCVGLLCLVAAAWLSGLGCFDPESASCPSDEEWQDRLALSIGLLLGGLAVVAFIAVAIGMPKTGIGFVVVAIALACWIGQNEYARGLFRPDPPPATEYEYDPAQCIPRSGGDSECPGG